MAHAALHLVTKSFALSEAGMLGESAEAATLAYEALLDTRIPIDQVWSSLNNARAQLLMGHLETAMHWAREAMVAAGQATLRVGHRMGLTVMLACLGQRGDVADVTELLPRLLALEPDVGFLRQEKAVGVAWALQALGRRREAIDVVLDAAADASASGLVGSEAFLRHEAVRLGDTTQAAQLARLADRSDSAITQVRAAHAAAIAARDTAGLVAASEAFAALGADLCAAEAATAAANRLQRTDAKAAGAQRARVAELLGRCSGAVTPGLQADEGVSASLSAREREIAALAAAGITSKEIATRLFVSSRTVENHLQHVYTKLGVSGRSELARALERA
jgi:DNA-binding CsgD family transcriptional regulator